MKKNILAFIFTLLLITLFACGGSDVCEVCTDGNGDGLCDACGDPTEADVREDVVLIENGEAKFQIVLSKDCPQKVRNFVNSKIASALRNKFDIDVKVVLEGGENDVPTDTEVLIGDVQNRGDAYVFDRFSLGEKGYAIKLVGKKLIVTGGAEEGMLTGLEKFADDILGTSSDDVYNVTVTASDTGEYTQDDYRITSLSVGGEDMRGYTIAADLSDEYYKEIAEHTQKLLYTQTGYYMKLVDSEEASEKSIIFKKIDRIYGEDSFKAYTLGKSLIIECAFDNMLVPTASSYFNERIIGCSGAVNFDETYKKDVSFVCYEDFGAVGDGRTDDFRAIWDTHAFANECGQTVKADPNATYYIFNTMFQRPDRNGVSRNTAEIRTNVDWQGAHFIIDDRGIGRREGEEYFSMGGGYIFTLLPNEEHGKVTISDKETLSRLTDEGINRDTEKIDLELDGWDGDLFLIVYNKNHKVFRRYPYPVYTGGDMRDIIIIDKDGKVSDETPITYDFQNISYIDVYKLDKSTAITVENGIFTTRACTYNRFYVDPETNKATTLGSGLTRGISVVRSYSTVRNIEHYVTGDMPLSSQVDEDGNIVYVGPTYSGFYSSSNATDVLFEDCILSGRRCYRRPQGGTDGTYDISGNMVNNLYFKNCNQHNFWVTVDPNTLEITPTTADDANAISSMTQFKVNGVSVQMHWGISATNFCKNFYFVDSTLSRYDAHCDVYNGGIINTTVNYVEITGHGKFIMDRMTYYSSGSNAVIPTRADYGWTWEGDVILSDVKAYVYTDRTVRLLYHGYKNWYFGYTCYYPNISVDNLDFYDIKTGEPLPPGYRIELTNSVAQASKMHLSESHESPIYSVVDTDGDGLIDEPLIDRDLDGRIDPPFDYDGDGNPNNTAYGYEEMMKVLGENVRHGIPEPSTYANFNITVPPSYVKIVGNDGVNGAGGYVFYVTDTSGYGISDGGYYGAETDGGFYGGTKFIFGEGEDDYVIGTDTEGREDIESFVFE